MSRPDENTGCLAVVWMALVIPTVIAVLADYRAPIVSLLMQPKAPYWIAGFCALLVAAFVVLLLVLALRAKPSGDIYSAQDTRRPWGES